MLRNIGSFAIIGKAQRKGRNARRVRSDYRTATALAGGLAATILLAVPAMAQDTRGGGGGQGNSAPGPIGGTSSSTGAGGAGAGTTESYEGAAGGGAGVTGGNGGNASDGGLGGAGGATAGAAGGDGVGGGIGSRASGGGGGAHGAYLAGAPGSAVSGGKGGAGGTSNDGDGGGGGAGGYGAVATGTGTIFFNYAITGGNGGDGGGGYFYGGSGGDGGYGLVFTGTGATASISGAITGGNGGVRGSFLAAGCCAVGQNGAGGIGLVGSDVAIVLHATISGGLNGNGVTRALAMRLGGVNQIALASGWGLVGGIEIAGTSLEFVQGNNQTLSNDISGVGKLIKSSIGNLTLSGNNSYAGGTEIRGGTLTMGNGATTGTLGSGLVSISSGAELAFNRSDNITVAHQITGDGQLRKLGTNTLTLSNSGNNYTGGTIVDSGTLALSNVTAAGAGTIWLRNGTTLSNLVTSATPYYANAIRIDTGERATINGNTSVGAAFDGAVTGGGDLTISGLVALLNTNSYGATTIDSNSQLRVGVTTSGTLGSGNVTNNGLLVFGRSDTVTVSNQISGSGDVRKTNGGTAILTGDNDYTGTTSINTGTIQIGDGGTTGALGSGNVTLNGNLTFNRSDDITVANIISGGGTLNKLGAGMLTLTGSNSGFTTISAGTLQVGDGGTTGSLGASGVLNDSILAFNRSDDFGVAYAISGNGSVIKLGGGVLTLSGNNGYFGTTTISEGTLRLGSAKATGSGTVWLDGGTLDVGAQSFDLAHLGGGTGTILASGGGSLSIGSGQSATFGSDGYEITSSLGLSVGAGSTLTLRGDNVLDGGIQVSGRLEILGSGAAGGADNRITTTGSVISYADGVDVATTIQIASDTTQLEVAGTDTATQNGEISEDQAGRGFEKIGTGTLILTAANSYTGTTLVSAGTLGLGDDLAAGTGSIALASGTTLLNVGGCICGGIALANSIDVTGTATIDSGGNQTYLDGPLTGGNIRFADSSGGGTITLTADNSYGDTVVGTLATLIVGEDGTTGSLGTGTVTVEDLAMLAFDRSDTVRLAAAISGDGLIGQFGRGTLILTGNNSNAGGTVILNPDGILQVGDGGTSGALGAGTIFNMGQLVFNRSDDITVSQEIAGDGRITKLGANMLTLSGDNLNGSFGPFAGTVSVQGGTLAITQFALGASELLEIDNGAQVKLLEDSYAGSMAILAGGGTIDTGAYTLEAFGGVDFQGELTKTGSGTLLLVDFPEEGTGSGGINVTAGTLGLGSDFAAGTGTIKLADGTTLLSCGCGLLTVGNAIQVATGGTVTIDADGGDIDLTGAISGGNVSFTAGSSPGAASTFTLTNANSHGATRIGANVELLLAGGTLGTGDLVFDAAPSDPGTPATVRFENSSDYSFGGRIVGSGIIDLNPDAAAKVTLTSSNSAAQNFTGTVNLLRGTLVLNGELGDMVGNSATLSIAGGALGGSGGFHGSVDIDNATLNPGNSPGTLAIAGNLTLGAGTILNFELGAPGTVGGASNDLVTVGGNLRLDGTLNVIAWGAGYGPGYYRLFNYGGALDDQGLDIGAIAGGLAPQLLTNIGGQVNIRLGGAQAIQYWDGADMGSTTGVAGGTGSWNGSGTNWTGPTGYAINDAWQGQVGVFGGVAGGTVTVDGTRSFEELRFETDGYVLSPFDASARLNTTGGFSIIDVANGLTADIGVIIQGGAGLDKTGTGTLILSGANTYGGATDIAAGTLRLGTANAISNQSALNVQAGATLDLAGFQTQAGSLAGAGNVLTGGGRLDVGYDNSSTIFSGMMTGADGSESVLAKHGSGTLTLSGAVALGNGGGGLHSFAQVNGGTLQISGTGSLSGDLIQNHATLENSGAIDAHALLQSFGTVTNNATGTISGTTQNFGILDNYGTMAALQVQSGGTATNHGTGVINGSVVTFTTFVSAGIVNGDVSNFGTAQLENQVNGQVLNQSSAARVTLTGAVTGITSYFGVDGSLLDLAGFDTTISGVDGSGSIQLGSATLTIDRPLSSSLSFHGMLSGSGGLVKTGAGEQILDGANNYTGPTAVNAGTLTLGLGGALTSDVTIANGAVFNNAGTVTGLTTNNGTLNGSGIFDGALALRNNGGASATLSGQANGAVENGGTFNAIGVTGITGFSQVAGGTLNLGQDLALGSLSGAGDIDLGSFTLTIGASATNTVFDGTISGSGGLTKTGTGSLTLTGTSAATGPILANAGTLILAGTASITGTVGNNATLVSAGTLNGGLANNGSATLRGTVNGLVQNLSGSITLSNALSGNGRFDQSGGATFNLAGFNASFGSLSGGGTIALGSGRLTVGSDNGTTSFAGGITGTGGLTKTGTGTLILAGASNYGGPTSIAGGTLTLADGGTIGTGTVSNDATLNFAAFADRSFANMVTGNGQLTKSGAGMVTLTGANSYAGGTRIFGGTIGFDNGQALGGTGVELSDGTALRNVQAGTVSLANDVHMTIGTGTLEGVNGSSTVLAGSISGADVRFAVSGAGAASFTLDGANSYRDTRIGAGATVNVAGGTLGSGGVNLANSSASLNFVNSANYDYAGVISGNGHIGVNTAGGASVTLSGSNAAGSDFTGTVTVDAGKLVLSGDFGDLTGNSASLTLNGGALGGSGTFHGDLTVGAGTLAPGNSPGTLSIAGNLNLGTGTILNFELGEAGTPGGANNDLINVGGNLVLDGTLNVTGIAGFGEGYYRLFNYGGTLTDNGLLFGTLPAGYGSTLLTNIHGQVNILFASSPQLIQYWDGTDLTGGSATTGGNGGAGVWNGTSTNWTAPTGYGVNDAWRGQVAVFGGAAGGSITVAGTQSFQELRFTTDGYSVTGATASAGLATTGGFSVIDVSGGLGATIDMAISGTGGLTKTGTGTLNLSGTNSYTGTTTVSSGTLTLAATGSLAGAVQNDATFNNNGAVAGLVTNTGNLASTGSLAGGLSNSGTASIAGTLAGAVTNSGVIGLAGATSGIGAVSQAGTGSFALNGHDTSFGSLSGTGTIALGGATLTMGGNNGSTSFGGVISGSGGLTKTGTGTFTLTGANGYTGLTTVSAGTLGLSATGSIAGALRNDASFNNAGTVAGLVTNGSSLASTGTLAGGLSNNGSALLSGTLAGAVANSGTIALTGAITGIGAVTQAATGSIALNGFSTSFATLAGAGTIDLGGALLTLGAGNGSSSFAGSITGNGGLTKAGTGTFTLAGTNSYDGVTTVAGGTLALAAGGSLSGNLLNQASFANAGTVNGMVQNDGTLTSTGTLAGGLLNNGTATLSGTIGTGVVNNGTASLNGTATIAALQQAASGSFSLAGFGASIGTLTGSGTIALGNGTLGIGAGNGNSSFAGTISGTGSLAKAGTGTLVITGAATHTGGTTIAAGTLQVGNGGTTGSLTGAIANNGVLAISRSDAVTLANAMSGTGGFVQAGTGTTTLTGANSYSGGTLVSSGRLRGDAASLQGAIRIDGALEFAQTGAGTYAGSLSGAGLFEKTGTGTLALSGNSATYSGATNVLAGTLAVNGLLTRALVTVSNGGTLGGTGTVGGITVQSGGTLAPGNSVGTLNVAGNVLFQAGSLFAAEVQASGADKVQATGTAQLGGTLQVINLGGSYAINSTYVLLHADAGVSGTFAVTNLASFGLAYRPKVIYTANEVQLFLAANQLSAVLGTGVPLTYNQASAIGRLDAAVVTGGYDPTPLSALYGLSPAAIPAALDQLSGEIYADATRAAIEDERVVREAVSGRLAEAADAGLSGTGGWGQVIGSWGGVDGDGNGAGYDVDRTGMLMGIDSGAGTDTGSWRAGVMGHYTRITLPADARASHATIDRTGGGFYAGAAMDGWRIRAGASLSLLDMKARRTIAVPGLTTSERGKARGVMLQSFAEISYRIEAGGNAFVEPYLASSVTRVTFGRFAESSGPVALLVHRQKSVLGIGELGLRGDIALTGGGRGGVRLGGNIGLRTAFGDRAPDPAIALAAAPSLAFNIRSSEIDRFSAVANLNLIVDVSDKLSLRLGYSGVQGAGVHEHGGRATLSLRF